MLGTVSPVDWPCRTYKSSARHLARPTKGLLFQCRIEQSSSVPASLTNLIACLFLYSVVFGGHSFLEEAPPGETLRYFTSCKISGLVSLCKLFSSKHTALCHCKVVFGSLFAPPLRRVCNLPRNLCSLQSACIKALFISGTHSNVYKSRDWAPLFRKKQTASSQTCSPH